MAGLMARSIHAYALDLLAARAYTVRNLRRKLTQKKFEPAEIDETVERLLSAGILDDSRYAADYVVQRLAAGTAIRRVKQELTRKGIEGTVADRAIAAAVEDQPVNVDDEIERLATKKLQSLGDIDDFAKRRRVFAFLARRGYELDDIKRVMNRAGR